MIKRLFLLFIVVMMVFVIAALPIMLGDQSGEFILSVQKGIHAVKKYFAGILSGKTFHYQQGIDRNPSFFKDIGRFFALSYFYLAASAFFVILSSVWIGIWQGKSNHRWVKDILSFLGAIPDFVIILILQLGIAGIYESTGVQLAKVASKSTNDSAILLPILTLSLIPAIYLIRNISEHTYDQLSENYVLMAKSKGIRKNDILFRHLLRNLFPFIHADLHKVTTIMIGNLFIVEYLYNLRGVTRLIFSKVGYQYNLVVNCLFAFIILSLLLFWTMKLFVFGLERIFAHD